MYTIPGCGKRYSPSPTFSGVNQYTSGLVEIVQRAGPLPRSTQTDQENSKSIDDVLLLDKITVTIFAVISPRESVHYLGSSQARSVDGTMRAGS